MKPHLNICIRQLVFNFGWYSGEPLKLFEITVFEPREHIFYVLVSLQILRFCIELCWDTGD